MNTTLTVFVGIIAFMMVLINIFLIVAIKVILKIKGDAEKFFKQTQDEINPIVVELKKIIEELNTVVKTAKVPIDKVDTTVDYVCRNVEGLIDKISITINSIHDNLMTPLTNIGAFLYAVSKTIGCLRKKQK